MIRMTSQEAGKKAHKIYEQIKGQLPEKDQRKYLEIDVLSGDYEIDADDERVHERLIARRPNGHFVLLRAEGGPAGTFGFFS